MRTLYIIEKDLKSYLSRVSSLEQIEYITLSELEEKLTFSYSKKTIVDVSSHFNLSIETTKLYLNNLRYIYSIDLKDNKFNILYEIKDFCIKNNLLNFHNLDLKNIKIISEIELSPFILNLLKDCDIEYRLSKTEIIKHNVYSFDNIDDEICYCLENISELIKKGIPLNKIKIINRSSDYIYRLKLYLNMYNIPFNYKERIPLYNTSFIKKALNILDTNSIENSLTLLEQEIHSTSERDLFDKLINLMNRYVFTSYNKYKNSLIYDLKNSYIEEVVFDNAISIDENVNEDDYIFILGFNQENYPRTFKNEDFLSDENKRYIGLFTSLDKNRIEKDNTLKLLSLPNITISFSSMSYKSNYLLSSIAEDYNFNVLEGITLKNTYSHKINKLRYINMLDNSSSNETIESFKSTYSLEYKKYDNKFKGIDKNVLYEYLDNYLPLSFTSLDTYYNCSFRYYLTNILKIDIYEDKFATFIGTIYHYVLSFAFKKDFDFETRWNEIVSTKELSKKELFLLNKLKKGLLFIIDNINRQNELINYDKSLFEQDIIYYIDGPIKIRFKGTIDKVLYKQEKDENDNLVTYAVIIDYKTYIPSLNIENIDYGLNMQLPIYIHLLHKIDGFEDAKVYGFYLQSIIYNDIIKHDDKKSVEEINKNNMKLKGYSINPVFNNGEFDSTRPNSELIDKLKATKNGYSKYAMLLSDDEMKLVEDITKNKIKDATYNILEGNFDIDPKYIDDELVGCSYCKFKDICYKKYEDTKYLDSSKKILVKEGDNDAMDS